MKCLSTLNLLLIGIALLVNTGSCCWAGTVTVANNAPTRLPNHLGTIPINHALRNETESIPTTHSRVLYLKGIINDKRVSSRVDMEKKSSALRLLGSIPTTSTVAVLIDNISFWDESNKSHPAVESLVTIGEMAIPDLLKAMTISTDDKIFDLYARCVLEIKRPVVKKFLEEQKSKLPPKVWKRLARVPVI